MSKITSPENKLAGSYFLNPEHSNEIIRICSQSISLRHIFDGHVKSSIETLNQCIECCVKWKMIYRKTALSQHKYSEKVG